jgi:hypothetical protein
LECDFVVFVALNRGYKKAKRSGDNGIREPEFYVMPIAYVSKVRDPKNAWGKIVRHRLVGIERFQNGWAAIRDFLSVPSKHGRRKTTDRGARRR